MGQLPWFKYAELIEDWLDFTVLEETKRGPALKNWLVGDVEKCTKDFLTENLWEQPKESSSSGIRWATTSKKKELIMFSSRDLSVQSSKKRKFRNG